VEEFGGGEIPGQRNAQKWKKLFHKLLSSV
jgi:hypothetical protein